MDDSRGKEGDETGSLREGAASRGQRRERPARNIRKMNWKLSRSLSAAMNADVPQPPDPRDHRGQPS